MSSPKSFRAFSAMVTSCLAFVSSPLIAAGMVPETPVVIVEQALGEATLSVRNTDDHPALLYSILEHLPEDDEPLVLLTPPVARVEPGKSQQVRFILRSDVPLKTERLKRVIFEGIKPRKQEGDAQVSLGVRQNIPMILRPANLPVDREPWKRLVWSRVGGQVQVSNPSPYVVRHAGSVTLVPGGTTLELGRTYILPGDVQKLAATSTLATHVRLLPATTYGFAVESYDALLSTQ